LYFDVYRLVSGGGDIKMTKDGQVLLKEMVRGAENAGRVVGSWITTQLFTRPLIYPFHLQYFDMLPHFIAFFLMTSSSNIMS
jgi:hypothetical protein